MQFRRLRYKKPTYKLISNLKNVHWSEPVLVLDKFGITNYRKSGHLIPWVEVDAVRLDTRGTSECTAADTSGKRQPLQFALEASE